LAPLAPAKFLSLVEVVVEVTDQLVEEVVEEELFI
jgi:hypothetical protein